MVIASNTHNSIDSARGGFSRGTYYEPFWNYTVHPRQPFTQATWTTGYATHYAPTLPHAGSYNGYSPRTLSSFYTTMTTYTGG